MKAVCEGVSQRIFDLVISAEEITAERDKVVAHRICRATHKGELPGSPQIHNDIKRPTTISCALFVLDAKWQIAYVLSLLLSYHLALHKLKLQIMVDLGQIAGIAFECNELDELRNEVLKHLENIFKSTKGNFVLTKGQKFDFDSAAKRGLEDSYLKLYDEYYWQFDPFFPKFIAPHPNVLSTKQLAIPKNFTRGEYYNDFLKPQSLHHQMTMSLRVGKQTLGVIAIFRPSRANDFSITEKRKFTLMAPLLSGALERILLLKEIAEKRIMLDLLANQVPYKGILMLNEAMELVYINKNGAKMMSGFIQAKEFQNKLHLDIPSELRRGCQELKNLTTSTGNPEDHRYKFNLHIPDSRESLPTTVRLIKNHEESSCFLVRLESNNLLSTLSQNLKKYGISRRELDVIYLLYRGLSNTQIATKLYISRYTVENHLKSIYRKLNIKNRTSLIYLINHLD